MADETLVEAALRVLNTSDPFEKAELGDNVASRWLNGAISNPYDPSADLPVPDRPARLSNVLIRLLPHLIVDCNFALKILCVDAYFDIVQVKLVSPSLMPKLGKAGSLQSRQAIVHSLVHTESWAIDLSWVLYLFLKKIK